MISVLSSEKELSRLPKSGAEAQKIRALYSAYGSKYDFCRFYVSENSFAVRYYDDFVICEAEAAAASEWSEFLNFCGYSRVFCSYEFGKELFRGLNGEFIEIFLMKLENRRNSSEKPREASPKEAFEIIKTGFDVDFEPWYLDMSHRIRHKVSKLYTLNGAALAVSHDLNAEALISQVAVLPEERGKGKASALLAAVCETLSKSSVFALCEKSLVPFYEKNGFALSGKKCEIIKNRRL